MRFLTKVARMRLVDLALLGEALFLLALARLALRLIPLRVLGRYFGKAPSAPSSRPAGTIIRRIRWAVIAAASHAPVDFVCFPQAIVAQRMLRRRGVASTMYYGVARCADGELQTHVWLMAGNRYVVGETATPFQVLRTFPETPVQPTTDLLTSPDGETRFRSDPLANLPLDHN